MFLTIRPNDVPICKVFPDLLAFRRFRSERKPAETPVCFIAVVRRRDIMTLRSCENNIAKHLSRYPQDTIDKICMAVKTSLKSHLVLAKRSNAFCQPITKKLFEDNESQNIK